MNKTIISIDSFKTDKGVVVILPRLTDYEGLITGIPTRTGPRRAQKDQVAPEPKATK
jgi:circadian clock protein KaiC